MRPVSVEDETFITRRATVDDLPQLTELWEAAHCYTADLEKRLTEFHIVVDRHHQRILAAIALHTYQKAALLHSEVYGDPMNQDLYRDMLWPRFQKLARTFGASRIWTKEIGTYWRRVGFTLATPEMLEKLPNFPIRTENNIPWQALTLYDENDVQTALKEKYVEALVQQQKDETATFAHQLRILRNVVVVLGISIIALMLILFLYSFATSYK